jgi:hypothetical protein
MKKVLVGGAALVATAWAFTVFAQMQAQTTKPTAVVDTRVLVPKAGAPAPSIKKPRAPAPAPAPVAATEKNALIASILAGKPSTMVTPPTRTTFTIGPGDLTVNGSLTGLTVPTHVTPDVATLELSGSAVTNYGALDGAWLIDCAVNTLGTTSAFGVTTWSLKDGAPTNFAQARLTASNGHVLFGAYFNGGQRVGTLSEMKNGNAFSIYRGEAFDWYSCTLTPVN